MATALSNRIAGVRWLLAAVALMWVATASAQRFDSGFSVLRLYTFDRFAIEARSDGWVAVTWQYGGPAAAVWFEGVSPLAPGNRLYLTPDEVRHWLDGVHGILRNPSAIDSWFAISLGSFERSPFVFVAVVDTAGAIVEWRSPPDGCRIPQQRSIAVRDTMHPLLLMLDSAAHTAAGARARPLSARPGATHTDRQVSCAPVLTSNNAADPVVATAPLTLLPISRLPVQFTIDREGHVIPSSVRMFRNLPAAVVDSAKALLARRTYTPAALSGRSVQYAALEELPVVSSDPMFGAPDSISSLTTVQYSRDGWVLLVSRGPLRGWVAHRLTPEQVREWVRSIDSVATLALADTVVRPTALGNPPRYRSTLHRALIGVPDRGDLQLWYAKEHYMDTVRVVGGTRVAACAVGLSAGVLQPPALSMARLLRAADSAEAARPQPSFDWHSTLDATEVNCRATLADTAQVSRVRQTILRSNPVLRSGGDLTLRLVVSPGGAVDTSQVETLVPTSAAELRRIKEAVAPLRFSSPTIASTGVRQNVYITLRGAFFRER